MAIADSKKPAIHHGVTAEEFKEMMDASRVETLQAVLEKQLEDEAYEHAAITRAKITELEKLEGVSKNLEDFSPEEVADVLMERFTALEALSVAKALLQRAYGLLGRTHPKIAEWLNCSIWQIDGAQDSIRHSEKPAPPS